VTRNDIFGALAAVSTRIVSSVAQSSIAESHRALMDSIASGPASMLAAVEQATAPLAEMTATLTRVDSGLNDAIADLHRYQQEIVTAVAAPNQVMRAAIDAVDAFQATKRREKTARIRYIRNQRHRLRMLGDAQGLPIRMHNVLMAAAPSPWAILRMTPEELIRHTWPDDADRPNDSELLGLAQRALTLFRWLAVLAVVRTYLGAIILYRRRVCVAEQSRQLAVLTANRPPGRLARPPGGAVLAEPHPARAPGGALLAAYVSEGRTRTGPCASPRDALAA